MQKIAIIHISEEGRAIALQLERYLVHNVDNSFETEQISRSKVGDRWNSVDAFIFIGAMGICVRTIAPYVSDKHSDPAVVCIDSMGRNVISVLSGHVGGANDLTRQVSALLGAHEVITTQSDAAGLWPLDTLHRKFSWKLRDESNLNACIFAFVNRQPTALYLKVRDAGTDYLERTLPKHVTLVDTLDAVDERFRLCIIVSPFEETFPVTIPVLQYVPQVGTLGIGLAHQAQPAIGILDEIKQALTNNGLLSCVQQWCTIDVKRDEPVVKLLQEQFEQKVVFYTASELGQVEVPNPSETVEKHVGTPSVCEAAALLGSNYGQLVLPKVKGRHWTVALAIDHRYLRRQEGFIEIVGAGPGDPDLVSVRGRRMLERADLILYAGSLVPRELTDCHKEGAVVRSSADMSLEEQCQLMKEHYQQGHFIVRLHTGDPCIYGAIQEQMAFFDREGMHYHITPGISSFLAAAAELRSQFTIPERTQTIILTRGEGRTPMPEKEQLHLLARSQSTMCIFLSASIVDDVQRELLMEYPEDTPVAACYRLTWPDQQIYRGVLKNLARIVHENNLTLTTMLVVGEAIDNRQGLSALYSKHFTHLFRKGDA